MSAAAGAGGSCDARPLGAGEAVVVTVWESVDSAILRNLPPGATELGRDASGIAEDVVDELDAATAEGAEMMAAEGAALATTAGFTARRAGSRGRSPVSSMVLGSVSYGVVSNSDRPVLIIPPGGTRVRRGS